LKKTGQNLTTNAGLPGVGNCSSGEDLLKRRGSQKVNFFSAIMVMDVEAQRT
jgi:hypothetical protein